MLSKIRLENNKFNVADPALTICGAVNQTNNTSNIPCTLIPILKC